MKGSNERNGVERETTVILFVRKKYNLFSFYTLRFLKTLRYKKNKKEIKKICNLNFLLSRYMIMEV